jgi:CheY-like chemotaxis protein
MYYTSGVAHILLVDDNQTCIYAGRELLLRHRPIFIVDTAFDAETALTAIRTHDYDVVVSDLVLPCLDGIALLYECHRIRQIRLWFSLAGMETCNLNSSLPSVARMLSFTNP